MATAALGACAAVAGCAATGGAEAAGLVCIGTEPFWRLDLTGERARYRPMEGAAAAFVGRLTGVANRSDRLVWRGGSAGEGGRGDLVAFLIRTGACSDGMSDRVYPIEALVSLPDGTGLQGCCRMAGDAAAAARPPGDGG